MLAVGMGHHAATRLLLEKGADATHRSHSGGTPLHHMSEVGSCDVTLGKLLLDAKCDAGVQDKSGRTALHWAVRTKPCTSKVRDFINWLLSTGVEVNVRDKASELPLDLADDLDIRQVLLTQHRDIQNRRAHDSPVRGYKSTAALKEPGAQINQRACHRCGKGLVVSRPEGELWVHTCMHCGVLRRNYALDEFDDD
mmetsp:Transcript_62654/g.136207  ORF Transcript_62654/g.136207 Transcript_62654/m.136207 type:complete len:196 (+) Transcript_62654:377-964(+)